MMAGRADAERPLLLHVETDATLSDCVACT